MKTNCLTCFQKQMRLSSVTRLGYFWKVTNFLIKKRTNIWQLLGVFWKMSLFKLKQLWLLFGPFQEKLGYFLFQLRSHWIRARATCFIFLGTGNKIGTSSLTSATVNSNICECSIRSFSWKKDDEWTERKYRRDQLPFTINRNLEAGFWANGHC